MPDEVTNARRIALFMSNLVALIVFPGSAAAVGYGLATNRWAPLGWLVLLCLVFGTGAIFGVFCNAGRLVSIDEPSGGADGQA